MVEGIKKGTSVGAFPNVNPQTQGWSGRPSDTKVLIFSKKLNFNLNFF